MRGSMVMTDALEVVAAIWEFLPGIFGRVKQLYSCIPIYWALLSEERPLAGSLICPTLPLSGRQEAWGGTAEMVVDCILEGLVGLHLRNQGMSCRPVKIRGLTLTRHVG